MRCNVGDRYKSRYLPLRLRWSAVNDKQISISIYIYICKLIILVYLISCEKSWRIIFFKKYKNSMYCMYNLDFKSIEIRKFVICVTWQFKNTNNDTWSRSTTQGGNHFWMRQGLSAMRLRGKIPCSSTKVTRFSCRRSIRYAKSVNHV